MSKTKSERHAPRLADFGPAHSIELRPRPDSPEALDLHMVLPSGEAVVLGGQREALRGLWSYLMQILYPRAVDLTRRIETVPQAPDGLDPEITYRYTAYADHANPGQVVIGGFAQHIIWKVSIDRKACEYLWASLEQHLDQV